MSVNVSTVKENVENEYRRLAQVERRFYFKKIDSYYYILKNCEQKLSSLYEEWITIEHDLLRERGLWGFEEADLLAKYKLDFIEGPCRMRKRMVLNEDFYKHYPYRANVESIVKEN